MITRRLVLSGTAAGLAMAAVGFWRPGPSMAEGTFEVAHSDAEWRSLLTANPCRSRSPGRIEDRGTGRR